MMAKLSFRYLNTIVQCTEYTRDGNRVIIRYDDVILILNEDGCSMIIIDDEVINLSDRWFLKVPDNIGTLYAIWSGEGTVQFPQYLSHTLRLDNMSIEIDHDKELAHLPAEVQNKKVRLIMSRVQTLMFEMGWKCYTPVPIDIAKKVICSFREIGIMPFMRARNLIKRTDFDNFVFLFNRIHKAPHVSECIRVMMRGRRIFKMSYDGSVCKDTVKMFEYIKFFEAYCVHGDELLRGPYVCFLRDCDCEIGY